MPATPGLFTSALHFGVFCTVCTVAWQLHVARQVQSLLPRNKKKKICPPDKKIVVISGCDRGFGRLLVEALVARQDDKFLVVALTLTDKAAQDLSGRHSHGVCAVRCDVTSDADVAVMKHRVEQLLQEEKSAILYAIVNNAGIANPGDFAWFRNMTIFETVMNVNFMGQVRVTQALLPLLLQTSAVYGGRILNLSSVCGTVASAGNSSYNASKFALEGLTDTLRLELRNSGIQVSLIEPGPIATQFRAKRNARSGKSLIYI